MALINQSFLKTHKIYEVLLILAPMPNIMKGTLPEKHAFQLCIMGIRRSVIEMQSKLTKSLAIIFVAAVLCSLFSGCAKKEPSPADTIEALEKAINHVDTEAFLSCLDSSWAQQLHTILALTVGESGISVEDFFSAVQFMLPIMPLASKGSIQAKDLPRIELTADEVEQNETEATVHLSGVLNLAGNQQHFSASVSMELEDGRWVICGIQ